MAEQKPRAPRARKKAAEPVAETTTAGKRATTPRTRKSVPAAVQEDDVAIRAYLLWEQGEPGDATEHWLRAEQELAAA